MVFNISVGVLMLLDNKWEKNDLGDAERKQKEMGGTETVCQDKKEEREQ